MEDGDCNLCIDTEYDGDAASFFTEVVRKARKPHECCECCETIAKGTEYELVTGKWDGNIDTYKTCLECAQIRKAFCCDGWVYGRLWESARNGLFEEMTTGCLVKLKTAKAKEKLLSEWRDWKFRDSK